MTFRSRLSFTVIIVIAFTVVFILGIGLAVLGFRSAGERAAVATADASLAEVAATVAARTNALVRPVLALAMNAAVLMDGLACGGPEGARQDFAPTWRIVDVLNKQFSPYEINPANSNPLRELLGRTVDFMRLREAATSAMFVCATKWASSSDLYGRLSRMPASAQPDTFTTIPGSRCPPHWLRAELPT